MKTTKANAPQGPITPVQTGIGMAQMTTAADSNNYMDSLVNDGKFTREEVDAAWEKAKKMANANKKKDPGIRMTYAYTTSLFNSILGVGKQPNRSNASVISTIEGKLSVIKINATARLHAAASTPKWIRTMMVNIENSPGGSSLLAKNLAKAFTEEKSVSLEKSKAEKLVEGFKKAKFKMDVDGTHVTIFADRHESFGLFINLSGSKAKLEFFEEDEEDEDESEA